MINTGPTNDKIYHRCIRLIQEFAKVNYRSALRAMLRAIYKEYEISPETYKLPVTEHIKRATPVGEEMHKQQVVLPLAVLLAAGAKKSAKGPKTFEDASLILEK